MGGKPKRKARKPRDPDNVPVRLQTFLDIEGDRDATIEGRCCNSDDLRRIARWCEQAAAWLDGDPDAG